MLTQTVSDLSHTAALSFCVYQMASPKRGDIEK